VGSLHLVSPHQKHGISSDLNKFVALFVRAEMLEWMAPKRKYRGQAFVGLIGPRIRRPLILALLTLSTDFVTTLSHTSVFHVHLHP
jgi:hypothetical protein